MFNSVPAVKHATLGVLPPALDRKVPVTQTLSFCQMHFLSPLPVAFDRKLVSKDGYKVQCNAREHQLLSHDLTNVIYEVVTVQGGRR